MDYFNTQPRNNQPPNANNSQELDFPPLAPDISHPVSDRSQFHEFALACGTTVSLKEIEAARLSYIPCTHDQPLFKHAHLWDSPTQINLDAFPQAHGWTLDRMQGVQIFTGKPTKRSRNGSVEYLTVLDVEVKLLERYPNLYQQIEVTYHRNIKGRRVSKTYEILRTSPVWYLFFFVNLCSISCRMCCSIFTQGGQHN